MAELNELLEQAVSEAEGLAQEAAHAQETVERLLQLAASMEAAVETGAGEARARLEQLSLRLSEAEAELAQESAGARGGAAAGRARVARAARAGAGLPRARRAPTSRRSAPSATS